LLVNQGIEPTRDCTNLLKNVLNLCGASELILLVMYFKAIPKKNHTFYSVLIIYYRFVIMYRECYKLLYTKLITVEHLIRRQIHKIKMYKIMGSSTLGDYDAFKIVGQSKGKY